MKWFRKIICGSQYLFGLCLAKFILIICSDFGKLAWKTENQYREYEKPLVEQFASLGHWKDKYIHYYLKSKFSQTTSLLNTVARMAVGS